MPSARGVLGATAPLVALGLIFAWWAWEQGAYFGVVALPGLMVLSGLLIVLLAVAPFPGRIEGPALIALVAIVGLAAWTALSGLWSPTPHVGPEYAFRVFSYAILFGLGIWVVLLLRERMQLALAPVGLAISLIAACVLLTIWLGSDTSWYLHPDGTLRFPFGYRNANATALLLAIWPLAALASIPRWPWLVRAALVAAITLIGCLAVMSQSRGSLPAFLVGALVFAIATPHRLRFVVVALLAAIPIAFVIDPITDVYRFGSDEPGVLPLLDTAAGSIALAVLAGFILAGIAFGVVESRMRLSARRKSQLGSVLAVAVGLLAASGAAAFLAERGGPVDFLEDTVDQFAKPASAPDFTDRGVRYGTNVQSNRFDFWRVAAGTTVDSPLLGEGAGSFRVEYLRERDSYETPHDPHSVPLLIASELGVVGLLLFVAFIVSAAVAALRSRGLGSRAALLAAVALAALAEWLTHASFDWFWQYPGLTGPVMFLLGASAAPRIYDPVKSGGRRWRIAIGLIALALAVSAMPAFVADRYSNRAAARVDVDPQGARKDLERAAALWPLDAQPLVDEARIAWSVGDEIGARMLLERALEREPSDFGAWYLKTLILARSGGSAAVEAYRKAEKLNPTDPVLGDLQRAVRQGRD